MKEKRSCIDDDDTKKKQLISSANVDDVKSKENKGDDDEGTSTALVALREANILQDGKSHSNDDRHDVDPTITNNSNNTSTGEASIPLPVADGLSRQAIYRGPQTPGAYVVRSPLLQSTSTGSTVSSSDEIDDGMNPQPPNLENTVTSAYYAVHAEVVNDSQQCPTAQVRPVNPKACDDIEAQKLRESSILVVNAKPILNKNSTKQGEEKEDESGNTNKSTKPKKGRKDIVCIQKQYLLVCLIIVIISVTLTILVTKGVFESDARPPPKFDCENLPRLYDKFGINNTSQSSNTTGTTQQGEDRLLRKRCPRNGSKGGDGGDDNFSTHSNSTGNNQTRY